MSFVTSIIKLKTIPQPEQKSLLGNIINIVNCFIRGFIKKILWNSMRCIMLF